MSSGLNCAFVEVQPGEWYYLLEDWDAPKESWDWREFATAYGPFSSYEIANVHLQAYQRNPGGHTRSAYEEGFQPDQVLAELIAAAPANTERVMRTTLGVSFDPQDAGLEL